MQKIDRTINVMTGFEKWLKANKLTEKSMGMKITSNWQEIMGNTINNHTERVDAKLPKIYLKINNSSLKQLLYNDSAKMIENINNYIGQKLVKEIIFT